MQVLIVKTSSLGDIIHTFPALTDASKALPAIQFDWLVEQEWSEIPLLHPAVRRIIPSAVRRWRQSWLRMYRQGKWRDFVQELQTVSYDCVIDAQGLIKSALLTRQALGVKHGFNRRCAREPIASFFYDRTHQVDWQQHAITRVRSLLAKSLGYSFTRSPDYGLSLSPDPQVAGGTIMLIYGTSWPSKRWPLSFWRQLACRLIDQGKQVVLPVAGKAEQQMANRIAQGLDRVVVLPKLPLSQIASVISACEAVVCVDTGLAHLAAALDRPGVSLYGASSAEKTGTWGRYFSAVSMPYSCAPCYQRQCRYLDSHRIQPCVQMVDVNQVVAMLFQQIAHVS